MASISRLLGLKNTLMIRVCYVCIHTKDAIHAGRLLSGLKSGISNSKT